MEELYGSVCYVGIDIDPELKYPKVRRRITTKLIDVLRVLLESLSQLRRHL